MILFLAYVIVKNLFFHHGGEKLPAVEELPSITAGHPREEIEWAGIKDRRMGVLLQGSRRGTGHTA